MFEKKIAAKNMKVVLPRTQFPLGTKWFMNDRIWTVTEVRVDDSTQIRKCQSTFGNEEVVTLATLHKDMKSDGFKFMDDEAENPSDDEKSAQ